MNFKWRHPSIHLLRTESFFKQSFYSCCRLQAICFFPNWRGLNVRHGSTTVPTYHLYSHTSVMCKQVSDQCFSFFLKYCHWTSNHIVGDCFNFYYYLIKSSSRVTGLVWNNILTGLKSIKWLTTSNHSPAFHF